MDIRSTHEPAYFRLFVSLSLLKRDDGFKVNENLYFLLLQQCGLQETHAHLHAKDIAREMGRNNAAIKYLGFLCVFMLCVCEYGEASKHTNVCLQQTHTLNIKRYSLLLKKHTHK